MSRLRRHRPANPDSTCKAQQFCRLPKKFTHCCSAPVWAFLSRSSLSSRRFSRAASLFSRSSSSLFNLASNLRARPSFSSSSAFLRAACRASSFSFSFTARREERLRCETASSRWRFLCISCIFYGLKVILAFIKKSLTRSSVVMAGTIC